MLVQTRPRMPDDFLHPGDMSRGLATWPTQQNTRLLASTGCFLVRSSPGIATGCGLRRLWVGVCVSSGGLSFRAGGVRRVKPTMATLRSPAPSRMALEMGVQPDMGIANAVVLLIYLPEGIVKPLVQQLASVLGIGLPTPDPHPKRSERHERR